MTVGELKKVLDNFDDSLSIKYKDDFGSSLSDICRAEKIKENNKDAVQLFSKGGYKACLR